MNSIYQQVYRVECNFGCKYFKERDKALNYFWCKVYRHISAELWLVTYCFCPKRNTFSATQELLDYSGESLPNV